MSYRIYKSETVSWLLHKTVVAAHRNLAELQGYRVPFSERRVLLFLVDSMLVLFSIWVAFMFWGQADTGQFQMLTDRMQQSGIWFPTLLAGWLFLAWLNDLYHIPSSYDFSQNVFRLGVVAALGLILYLFIFFAAPADALPRIFFLNFLFIGSSLVAFWRFCYIRLSELLPFPHRVLIAGTGRQALTITEALDSAPGLKYEIIGYISDSTLDADATTLPSQLPVIGRLGSLSELVDAYQVHEVIIAIEPPLNHEIVDLLIDCQSRGIHVSWMPNLYEKLLRRIPVKDIDPTWALQATTGQPIFSRVQLGLKRCLDIILTVFALPTLLFLFPLIAAAIRLDSSGPIFYRQERCGRGGRPFTILKFRTMLVGAEEVGKPQWATYNDVRVTRLGRILRRTRLDELPQLFNILIGDMSLVGPRPERPEFVHELQDIIPYYRARLMVKPGLTGWAQVHYPYGNTAEDAEMKLEYDFYYVRYWSIWLDLYTIFRTFGVLFRFEGI